jgi:mannose-6-phosphate isomerase-like protein (cupin superfamily)
MSRKLWVTNIEKDTLKNKFWRHVIYTSKHLQVTLMSVPVHEQLGWEVHKHNDQFFRVEHGRARIQIKSSENSKSIKEYVLTDGMTTVVPQGTWHNVKNSSRTKDLKLYTIYGPPHHPKNRRDKTHEDELLREMMK